MLMQSSSSLSTVCWGKMGSSVPYLIGEVVQMVPRTSLRQVITNDEHNLSHRHCTEAVKIPVSPVVDVEEPV